MGRQRQQGWRRHRMDRRGEEGEGIEGGDGGFASYAPCSSNLIPLEYIREREEYEMKKEEGKITQTAGGCEWYKKMKQKEEGKIAQTVGG